MLAYGDAEMTAIDAKNVAKVYREMIVGEGNHAIVSMYMEKLVELTIDILSRTSDFKKHG